jgi:hypothetical protein
MTLFKTFAKRSEFDLYQDLDTLPIWNWYKLHKANDLKYLLKMDNYSRKVQITQREKELLEEHYKALIYSFEKIDLSILEAQRDYQVMIMELIIKINQESKDAAKLDKAFTILNGVMLSDEPVSRWLYEVDYIEIPEHKKDITRIAVAVERYNAMKKRPHSEQTLNEKVVMLERILSVKIDPKVCPVSLFQEYERQAVEKVNSENKLLQ